MGLRVMGCDDIWQALGTSQQCCESCHQDAEADPWALLDAVMMGGDGRNVHIRFCCEAMRAAEARWGLDCLAYDKRLPWEQKAA